MIALRVPICECGARFESPQAAVTHAKENLHRVTGLYYSHRLEVEEHFHACGICTHVEHRFEDGVRTICSACNPVAVAVRA